MPKPYSDDLTHEALHAVHIASDIWLTHVLDSRCTAEFKDVKAAAETAMEAMGVVYQLIGQKFKD